MTNKQIFDKAIVKAVKNGYHKGWLVPEAGTYCEASNTESDGACVYTTIFDHDFAKAFWGEETAFGGIKKAKGKFIEESILKEYQYHLQQMVLKKEPLKYLEKFL